MEMTYEEAKAYGQTLEEKDKVASSALKAFDVYRLPNGLTPDHIKATPEWQIAKEASRRSIAELRNFYGWFNKKFKKEIKEDRKKNKQYPYR